MMTLIGHASHERTLMHLAESRNLPPALLFIGPEGVGKALFAKTFAERILASPFDVHFYRPEGKTGMHSLDQLRQFSEEVFLKPLQGHSKVFIFEEAHRMLPTGANALLKTLEEPADDTLIILITHLPASLLPTIRSRCQTVRFGHLDREEMALFIERQWGEPPARARQLALNARGSLGRAKALLEGAAEAKRDLLLRLLSHPKPLSYLEIKQFAAEMGAKWEGERKEREKAFEQQFKQRHLEELSAVQREAMRQEFEGGLAITFRQEVHQLFEELIGWYRDLQLLKVGGERTLLHHPDWQEALDQALQRGELLPLEEVQEALSAASLALERHTPATLFLESLLLKL